jgi:hypothetical protein
VELAELKVDSAHRIYCARAYFLILQALSVTVNALAAAGDVFIAGTLTWLLHRSRTGFHRYFPSIFRLRLSDYVLVPTL